MHQIQQERLFAVGVGFAVATGVGVQLLREAPASGAGLPWPPLGLVLIGLLGMLGCGLISRRVWLDQQRAARAPLPPGRTVMARMAWLGPALMFLVTALPAVGLSWMVYRQPGKFYGPAALMLSTLAALCLAHLVGRLAAPKPFLAMDDEGIFHAQLGHVPWEHVEQLELIRTRFQLQQSHALALFTPYAKYHNRFVPRWVLALRRASPTERRFLKAVLMPLDGLNHTPQALYANALALHRAAHGSPTAPA